jgi:hypothetical protein
MIIDHFAQMFTRQNNRNGALSTRRHTLLPLQLVGPPSVRA